MSETGAGPAHHAPLPVRVTHAARARPILLLALVAAGLALVVLPQTMRPASRFLLAWDSSVLVYMLGVAIMIARDTGVAAIRNRAENLDYGRSVVLAVTVGGAVASLFAIVLELGQAKAGGQTAVSPVALSVATVALSWTFTHVVFALHYAHEFHGPDLNTVEDDTRGGLTFPGTEEPAYVDFLYFAFVIGCACATADVNITSRSLRRLALVHGVVSFVFNTAIVALSINIAAGLLAS